MIGDLRQDFFTLGLLGVTLDSPGRCKIIGAGDGRKWDERVGYGLSGASLFGGGKKLSHFALEIALWDEPPVGNAPPTGQWLDYMAFQALFTVAPGVKPPSLGVSHPILADVGITQIVIEEQTQWDQDDTGLWTKQLKCIQYKAPTISFSNAAPGVDAAAQGTPGAETANQQAIAAASDYLTSGAGGATF